MLQSKRNDGKLVIKDGLIVCPNCGQELEFDISCDECGGCADCDDEE